MSKKSIARNKDKRKKQKQANKAAMKARYEGWARDGENGKSKRFRAKSSIGQSRSKNHPYGNCGNLGCLKCSPTTYMISLSKPGTVLFERKFRSAKLQALLK
jgi:hypothetical protein